jgi:hypothetical protein
MKKEVTQEMLEGRTLQRSNRGQKSIGKKHGFQVISNTLDWKTFFLYGNLNP